MQKCIDNFQEAFFGIGMTEAKQKGMCVTCKAEATHFSKDIYKHEYEASGMCEKCQSEIFTAPPENTQS
jgi:hypothetical protein